jgi:hypothetical protein
MDLTNNKLFKIRIFTALISLTLSIFAYFGNDIINRDGILYMNMAEAFLQGGLAETVKLYNWPFFSILVACIHQLTSLPLEASAYLLNALLLALMLDTLLLISNKLLIDKQQLAIAAVLFICFQSFNEYRDFIIRDFGYWAFCSLTLYRFIVFLEKPTITNATLWQLVAVTAVLFRIEGTVILLGLPLYLFIYYSPKIAFQQSIKLNYLFIIGVIAATGFAIEMSGSSAAFSKIMSISDYINPNIFLESFKQKASIIETQVLNQYSAKYSAFILSTGLIFMLFYKLVKAISFGYLGVYLLDRYQRASASITPYRSLIIYFAILNLAILLAFLFHEYFMSRRYTIVMLISLLLLMLPRLTHIIAQAWSSRNKTLLIIISLILLIGLIDGITSSRSKTYIKDTAIWASKNLPEDSIVATADVFIEYYFNSNQPKAKLTKIGPSWMKTNLQLTNFQADYQNYDYLVVVEKRKNMQIKNILASLQLEQVYSQETKRHNKASVYKIVHD